MQRETVARQHQAGDTEVGILDVAVLGEEVHGAVVLGVAVERNTLTDA